MEAAPEPPRPTSAIELYRRSLEEPDQEVPELTEERGRGSYREGGKVHGPSKGQRLLSTALLSFAAPLMGPQATRQMAEDIFYGPYLRARGQAEERRQAQAARRARLRERMGLEQAEAQANAPDPAVVGRGQRVVDRRTGRVIYEGGPEVTEPKIENFEDYDQATGKSFRVTRDILSGQVLSRTEIGKPPAAEPDWNKLITETMGTVRSQQEWEAAKGWLQKKGAPPELIPAKWSAGAELPAGVREYEYAKKQGFKGTFEEWKAKSGIRPTQTFSQERQLRADVFKELKNYPEVVDQINRIEAGAKDPTAAGDIAILFNFMKMLDPASVVRESEFATAASAGGWEDRARAALNRVNDGKRLSAAQRKDFVDTARNLFKAVQPRYQRVIADYKRTAEGYGLDPDKVLAGSGGTETPASVSGVVVTLPSGESFRFPNQEAADGFKKELGIQ